MRTLLIIAAAAFVPFTAAAQAPTPTPKLPFVTGLVFADATAYQSIPLALAPLMGELPKSVDLSPSFPKPGNQGQQSSCVGWAVAYALKSFQEQQERQWGSDANTFSPSYIYNQIRQPGASCQQGTQFLDALNLLTREGVAKAKDFPYVESDCSKKPTAAQKQAAQEFAVASWRRVNVQDETEMKAQLASGFPVLIGSMVDYPFMTLRGSGTYSTYAGPNVGAHAMTVVGYDDAKSAFRLINSWGTSWGDGGFAWVSYAAFRQMVREGYVVQDIVVSRPQPTPTQVVTHATPTPPPPATPVPTPWVNPKSPAVNVSAPVITHNLQTPRGWAMSIQLPGQIQNAKGHSAQIVVRFAFANGTPLMANAAEREYRDATGLVATGTAKFVVTGDPQDLSSMTMVIPYYALNLMPTNGVMNYQLLSNAQVYIDDFPMTQSGWSALGVRW